MKTTLRCFASVLALLLASATLLRAQVTVTVNATANATGEGYTLGNSYTFIFTTGASFASNPSSSFTSTVQNYFEHSATTDNQLWSSISGTGLGGAFIRPVGDPEDPHSILRAGFTGTDFYFQATAETEQIVSQNIGLTTLASTAMASIHTIVIAGNLPSFAFPATYVNPNSYFATYNGTYSGFSTIILEIENTSNFLIASFSVTSLTISAIPEPSTYAAIFGAAALGFVAYRRRQKLV